MNEQTKRSIAKWCAALVITTYLALIFYSVSGQLLSSATTLQAMLRTLGKTAGLIGFLFLSLLIFSGDTARYFDRYFGMDKIIKFQRKFAITTAIFVLAHPIFFMLSRKKTAAVLTTLIPNFAMMPLALGIIALYLFIAVMIASAIHKKISYTAWQYIHILIYALFFISLYHAVKTGSDSKNPIIISIYITLLLLIIIGIIYRTTYKIKQKNMPKFYVKKVQKETHDTFTLILTSQKKLRFKAGQFCFLRINKNNLHARHPFTISGVPSSSPKDKELRFTIKTAGRFTQTAAKLKKGEEVIVDGPYGIFTLDETMVNETTSTHLEPTNPKSSNLEQPNQKKDIVFIAGGVGITPFMSMITDKINKKNTQKITLLYGSKTGKDIIFKKELDKVKAETRNLKIIHVISNEKNNKKNMKTRYEHGNIDKQLIQKYVKNPANSLFYICGPEPMKKCVKKALSDIGIKKQSIYVEDFFW